MTVSTVSDGKKRWYLEEIKTYLLEHEYQSYRLSIAITLMERRIEGSTVAQSEINEIDLNLLQMKQSLPHGVSDLEYLYWDAAFKRHLLDAMSAMMALIAGRNTITRIEEHLTQSHIAWRVRDIAKKTAIKILMSAENWQAYLYNLRDKTTDLVNRKRGRKWRVER